MISYVLLVTKNTMFLWGISIKHVHNLYKIYIVPSPLESLPRVTLINLETRLRNYLTPIVKTWSHVNILPKMDLITCKKSKFKGNTYLIEISNQEILIIRVIIYLFIYLNPKN